MYDYRRSQPFEVVRVPRTNTLEIAPGSFVLLPVGWMPETNVEQRLVQQWIYQWAWAQAQAVLRPSLPERDLLAVWN